MIGAMWRVLFPGLLAVCLVVPVGAQKSSGSATSPAEMQREIQQHIDRVTSGLTGPVIDKNVPHSMKTLSAEMAAMHVPGVSIAVVHNGVIEWAQGFGVVAVTPETLFQAGSISKPVAAMAALRLVQQAKMGLDTDINTYLTSWKLPTSNAEAGKTVTLRELLTHTGGQRCTDLQDMRPLSRYRLSYRCWTERSRLIRKQSGWTWSPGRSGDTRAEDTRSCSKR